MYNRLFDPSRAFPSVRSLMDSFDVDADTARRIRRVLRNGDRNLDVVIIHRQPPYPSASVETARLTYPTAWAWSRSLCSFPNTDETRLHMLGDLIDGACGVEGWATSLRDGVSYLNTGDAYSPTIAITPDGWFIGDLATLVERWPSDSEEN